MLEDLDSPLWDTRKDMEEIHEIWEKVLIQFNEQKDIDFAYPTTRFYKQSEGI